MNAQQAATLCRAAKSVCPQQKFDEFTPDFWHPLLEDIDFEDAKKALIEVAKRQPFVSPAEIRAQVGITRKRMVAAIPAVVPPWQLADLPADEQRWVASYRHAIADGLPSQQARMRANHQAGLVEDEPLSIEERPLGSLHEALTVAEQGRLDKKRLAEIRAEVEKQAITAAKEAAQEREIPSVDEVLRRHEQEDL